MRMEVSSSAEPEFVDDGTGEIRHADGLHDIDVIGSDAFFTMFEMRKTPGGIWYKGPAYYSRMPIAAIGPAAATVARKLPGLVLPTFATAFRGIARH